MFYIILTIFVLDFIVSRTLSALNIKASNLPIPEEIADLYSPEKREKQRAYFVTNAKFSCFIASLSFLAMLAMLLFDGFAWVDGIARQFTDCELLVSLIFFGVIYIAKDIMELPFSIYHTFHIETKFGFNRNTPLNFAFDHLKSFALSLIIYGAILTAIILIYEQIPNYFWLLAWAVVSGFSLFMSLFYSDLIVPLFNKQTPLEQGELRDAIEQFAQKVNFELKNIYVINSSKRSTKANAYFTGWGRKKRIVLYDTLIEQLTTDEIVAVLAHEIGHNKHHHTLKSLALTLPANLVLFTLLGYMLGNDTLAQAMGCAEASFHINIMAFSFLYAPISMLLDLLLNYLSRQHEYQADDFVKQNGNAEHLILSLKKISGQALSNPTPHPAFVFVHFSHPTLVQRIQKLRS